MNHEAVTETALLGRAFGRFNETAETLGCLYERLTGEAERLSRALEDKNRELDCSQKEHERTNNFLTHIIDNLGVGIAVFSLDGSLVLANRTASILAGDPEFMGSSLDGDGDSVKIGPTIESLAPGGYDPSLENRPRLFFTEGPGGRLLSTSVSGFPWPEEEGGGDGLIAVIEDVTDQAHIGAQRERTHTLAAMGDMAAEIAHQIRNPLGGVELFAEMLGREVSGDENLTSLVNQVQNGVKQVGRLISNYLILVSPPHALKTLVSLGNLISAAVSAAGPALEEAGFIVAVEGELSATIEADAELLQQAFLSLIFNAVDAAPVKGRLEIEIRLIDQRVEMLFSDNGRGLPTRDVNRAFNPFFTTKEKNLGLGLAVCHRIIDAHQGWISIKNRNGHGAVVTVALPVKSSGRSALASPMQ